MGIEKFNIFNKILSKSKSKRERERERELKDNSEDERGKEENKREKGFDPRKHRFAKSEEPKEPEENEPISFVEFQRWEERKGHKVSDLLFQGLCAELGSKDKLLPKETPETPEGFDHSQQLKMSKQEWHELCAKVLRKSLGV